MKLISFAILFIIISILTSFALPLYKDVEAIENCANKQMGEKYYKRNMQARLYELQDLLKKDKEYLNYFIKCEEESIKHPKTFEFLYGY